MLLMMLLEDPELAVPGINVRTFLHHLRGGGIFFSVASAHLDPTLCCNDPLTSEVKCKSIAFTYAVLMKVLSEGCVVLQFIPVIFLCFDQMLSCFVLNSAWNRKHLQTPIS